MSPAYINNIGMFITNSSVPTLQNLADISVKFKSMKAVIVKNTTNEIWLKWLQSNYYPDMLIEYQNDFAEVIKRISSDPQTFASVDFTYYFQAIRERVSIKRHPCGDNNDEQFGIICLNQMIGMSIYKNF